LRGTAVDVVSGAKEEKIPVVARTHQKQDIFSG
jgi:hypothetical protein